MRQCRGDGFAGIRRKNGLPVEGSTYRQTAFHERLEAAFRQSGRTKRDVARLLRVDASLISHWLHKGGEPTFAILLDLCRILRVDPNWLLGWSQGTPRAVKEAAHVI